MISRKSICGDTIWIKVLFLLPFINLANGACQRYTWSDSELYGVKCVCSNPNEVVEITPDESMHYKNATSWEIKQCQNVVLHPNLFRTSYNLQSISISQVDKLSLSPALSFPVNLKNFSLSAIKSLDHFPVPGPSSAVLHSVRSMELLSLKDVTITTQPTTSDSSFIDLPITTIQMIGVKFVGTIPKGMLHFNSHSLTTFSAINCQFDDMAEGSLYINATGNVTIDNCKFKSMEPESMKVYGQSILFHNNVFMKLSGTHSISIQGHLYVSIMKNFFKNLGAPHALLLSADNNALVYLQDNHLPCGCYADNFIPAALNSINKPVCRTNDSLVCALQQKQYCHHANNKNESIEISRPGQPPCPSSEPATMSGSADRGQIADHITFIALCISSYMITHGVMS